MAGTHKVDATNLADGPRMFNSIPPVSIPAGQSFQDLLITDGELESMKRFGEFEIKGGAPDKAEPGPLDGSVDELTAHLANMTDADEVQKLFDAETAGKSRKGALSAIEARRDELLA
ncbi:hypothetical protein [Sphingomonas faeni]|uniref:hypothetical protein n=1 Tax=Sphingomonas faeni TaxID=185950 RepID=UPI0033516478